MPIIASSYKPPLFFKNSHFSTMYPNLFRKVKDIKQKRERVELNDGDFIDIDWTHNINRTLDKLTIIIHGLEGNSKRQYMLGLTKHLVKNNWNVAAINLRSCSDENNRLYKSYHAGCSNDLDAIINHIIKNYPYTTITLVGFSLGGNVVLKYLGEGNNVPNQIKAAVGVSVPCDLYDSLCTINKVNNYLYRKRFIISLKKKLYERQKKFPNQIYKNEIRQCKSLLDIDNLYTSKAHGFEDAKDYYKKCSSLQFLNHIETPTLIINAKNDSFLGNHCYPVKEAENNINLYLEVPNYGGHVGFYLPGKLFYNESRIVDFFAKKVVM